MHRTLALLFLVAVALPIFADDAAVKSVSSEKTLPKVVLVGDSIRLSYASVVSKELKGKATIVSPKPNGGDSSNVLKNLDAWVIREPPTIVQFNCGIHDTKKFTETGSFQVSPEQYEANLRKIVAGIRAKTKAKILFATSTPILDDRALSLRKGRNYVLSGASISQYNDIARRVMKELHVPVNDVHKTVSSPPKPHQTSSLIGKDGVHLTASGKHVVGKQVASFIDEHLR